jgi:hypothetical protein
MDTAEKEENNIKKRRQRNREENKAKNYKARLKKVGRRY